MGETLQAGHLAERKRELAADWERSATLCVSQKWVGMEEGVDIEVEPRAW